MNQYRPKLNKTSWMETLQYHVPRRYSILDPGHSREWIVGISKGNLGLVWITQDVTMVLRWSLWFQWRAEITQQTFIMFGKNPFNYVWKEKPGQKIRDSSDEDALLNGMKSFNLMDTTASSPSVWKSLSKKKLDDQWNIGVPSWSKEIRITFGHKVRESAPCSSWKKSLLYLTVHFQIPLKSKTVHIPRKSWRLTGIIYVVWLWLRKRIGELICLSFSNTSFFFFFFSSLEIPLSSKRPLSSHVSLRSLTAICVQRFNGKTI